MKNFKIEEPLSTSEHIQNFIYTIFKYLLYFLAFAFIYTYTGKLFTFLLITIFVILSYCYSHNQEKIIKKCYVKYNVYMNLLDKYLEITKEKTNEIK